MVGKKKTYSCTQKFIAVLMIVSMIWLTISTPFVFRAQQAIAKQQQNMPDQSLLAGNEEESNTMGGSTEGKALSLNTLTEDFLHDCHLSHYFSIQIISFHGCENADTYVAFHGEMDVPPPDFS
jgi:hypothetical protein